jgi:xanthine dehydrogenase accessory factor
MKELISTIKQWTSSGHRLAIARVIQTWGSSPRPSGSCMIISDTLEMAGSVSGGCVEGAVVKEAKKIFDGAGAKRLFYGVSDDDAWAVGLSCGGKIQVYIQPWLPEELSQKLIEGLSTNKNYILATSLEDGNCRNTLITTDRKTVGDPVPEEVIQQSILAFNQRAHEVFTCKDTDYFIQVFPRRGRMVIIGAAHVTADLVALAQQFDFETIVIDPRGTFAKNTNFTVKPDFIFEKYPSEVLSEMELDPYTYAVILSHDPKIDDDALQVLLRSNVAYIGALGSKKNHEKRTARLIEKGFTAEEISKINAPIGMDIHAVGAKEIALSILGAVIRAKNENL